MNILITGAKGFIGKNLSEYLEKKHNVFNLISKPMSNLNIKNQIAIDLTDYNRVKSYFSEFGQRNRIDSIVHLAGKLASPDNIDDMNIFYYNIKITKNIVEIVKLLKPKKIINFSSMAVYPNKDGVYSETSEVRPSVNTDCLYGLSKFCSENILDFMLRKEKIIISHLRVSQVYGEGMRKDRIFPVMLKELKQKNSITLLGKGERVSNFISVQKILKMVNFFLEEDIEGIYNVGGKNISYLDSAQRLIQQYGNEKSKIIKEPKGLRVKFYLDTARINKLMRSKKL